MQPDPRYPAGWRQELPPQTGWWFLIPMFTCGYGTPVMVFIAGVKLRSRLQKVLAGVYTVAVAAAITLAAVTDGGPGSDDDGGNALTTLVFILVWLVGTIHVAILQNRVRDRWFAEARARNGHAGPPPGLTHYPPPAWHQGTGVDPALAAAQWRAARRQEARQLQAAQPAMASELMVGRPDLPGRQYDDGGLIDVNHVSAEWLQRYLTIERSLADRIVEARDRHNGFSTPEELVVYCEGLTPAKLDLFRDRLIFIPR
jgi:hypothetical protein